MSEDQWLSPEDVAARLGISRLTVVRWVRSGKLKGQKLGKKTVRVNASDLDAFTRQQQPTLTLVGATAPAHESAHIAYQRLDADTLALAAQLRQPGESLSDVVHRALAALQQAQDAHEPAPMTGDAQRSPQRQASAVKEPMFSDQRREILTLLRQHPEGLSPVQARERLGSAKDLGTTMKHMVRDGLLRRLRAGLYAVQE